MERITLNVGGRRFETTRATLARIPYVHDMLEDVGGGDPEEIFINRSSTNFEQVLAFVLDPLHPYPLALLYELKFYGVAYEEAQLFDAEAPQRALSAQLTELQAAMPLLYNGLENVHFCVVNLRYRSCCKCSMAPRPGQLICEGCSPFCMSRKCKNKSTRNLCDEHRPQYTWVCDTKGCPNTGPDRFCFVHSARLNPAKKSS